MTDKLHDLRLRQLPNGGYVLTNAGTQPGWMEYEIGAYGNASEALDALWGIIGPKPEEMEPERPGTTLVVEAPGEPGMSYADYKALQEVAQ